MTAADKRADQVKLLATAAWLVARGCSITLRTSSHETVQAFLKLISNLKPDAPLVVKTLPSQIELAQLCGGIDLTQSLAKGKSVAYVGLLRGTVILQRANAWGRPQAAAVKQAMQSGQINIIAIDDRHTDDESSLVEWQQETDMLVDLRQLNSEYLDLLKDAVFPEMPQPVAHEADLEAATVIATLAAQFGVKNMRPLLAAQKLYFCLTAESGFDHATKIAFAIQLGLLPHATQVPQSVESQPQDETEERKAADSADHDAHNELDQELDELAQRRAAEEALTELILEAALAKLPEEFLKQLAQSTTQSNRGRQSSAGQTDNSGQNRATQASHRGCPVGISRRPQRPNQRPSLVPTLIASLPWQKLRMSEKSKSQATRLKITRSDFRYQKRQLSPQSLLIFLVDASGSAALARLAETKGAIEILLAASYSRRDQVCLISFRNTDAELILPPTRALARARRSLAGLPGGGATPIAAGLDQAIEVIASAKKKGLLPTVILLSDGRANISRQGEPGRARALEEACSASRQLSLTGADCLVIDTSWTIATTQGIGKAQSPALQIAQAMRAQYFNLPMATSAGIADRVRSTLTH